MARTPSSIIQLHVVQLWLFGNLFGEPRAVDFVEVALAVDLPVDEVPWLGEPVGAQQWAYATRLVKNPIVGLWRSVHAPVWNHHIERPVLLWSLDDGLAEPVLAAAREGELDALRPKAPAPEELRTRLNEELEVSLGALRRGTEDYEERRWRPGKMEPVADALWRASNGYLDVLNAVTGG